jgi:hypothetical protein
MPLVPQKPSLLGERPKCWLQKWKLASDRTIFWEGRNKRIHLEELVDRFLEGCFIVVLNRYVFEKLSLNMSLA